MKKLLALLLVFVLALTACLTTAVAETRSVLSETDVDRDVLALGLAAMGKNEAFILKADTLAAVVTEASTRFTLDDTGFQWDLMLGGKDILPVAGEMDDEDDNFILGSNLIPNYVFTFSNEEMGKLFTAATDRKTREQTKALSRIDLEALGRAVNPHIDDFIAAVTAAFKPGEAQQGEYVKNGVSYNTMWPIEVDTVAIAEALNQLEQDLLADPTVAVTIAQFGELKQAAEAAIDPAKAPEVRLESYMNVDASGNPGSDSDTYFTVTPAGKKDPAMTGDVVSDGENVTATVEAPAANIKLVLQGKLGVEGKPGSINKADLYVKDKYFGLVVEGDEQTSETSIYFVDPQNKLVSQRDTVSNDGERTFDLTKGTPVTSADMKDEKTKSAVSMDAMMGLAGIYSAASEALPEEVGAMVALLNLAQSGSKK